LVVLAVVVVPVVVVPVVVVPVVVVPVVVAVGVVPLPLPIPGQVAAYAAPPPPASVTIDAATATALRLSLISRSSFGSVTYKSAEWARNSRGMDKSCVGTAFGSDNVRPAVHNSAHAAQDARARQVTEAAGDRAAGDTRSMVGVAGSASGARPARI
jgi:hypothetical protein